MRRLLLALLLLFGTPAWSAVALHDTGTVNISNTPNTTFSSSGLTITAGTNLAVEAAVCWGLPNISGVTATWNGTSMFVSTVETDGVNMSCAHLGLHNPSTGTGPLVINWTGSSTILMMANSWTGVNQATNSTTFYNITVATGTSTGGNNLVTCTSITTGDEAVDAISSLQNLSGVAQQSILGFTNGGSVVTFGTSSAAGTGVSIGFGWNIGPSGAWLDTCIGIKQAGGGGGLISNILMNGM